MYVIMYSLLFWLTRDTIRDTLETTLTYNIILINIKSNSNINVTFSLKYVYQKNIWLLSFFLRLLLRFFTPIEIVANCCFLLKKKVKLNV